MIINDILKSYIQEQLFNLVTDIDNDNNELLIQEIFEIINYKIIEENKLDEKISKEIFALNMLFKYGKKSFFVWIEEDITINLDLICLLIEHYNERNFFEEWFYKYKPFIKELKNSTNINTVIHRLIKYCPDLVDIWGKELEGILFSDHQLLSFNINANLPDIETFMYLSINLPDKIKQWFPIFQKHNILKRLILSFNTEKLKELQLEHFLKR